MAEYGFWIWPELIWILIDLDLDLAVEIGGWSRCWWRKQWPGGVVAVAVAVAVAEERWRSDKIGFGGDPR